MLHRAVGCPARFPSRHVASTEQSATPRAFALSAGLIAVVFVAVLSAPPAWGQEIPPDSLVEIVLKDGTKLVGTVIHEDSVGITMETIGDLTVEIPRHKVMSVKPARGRVRGKRFYRRDPNYSRLLLTPSGRPLRKGEGYFSDTYLFLPSVTYALTDQLSILVGFSVLPGVALDDQLFYISPRIGTQISPRMALSAGVLYATIANEGAAGSFFVMGSWGDADKFLSAGVGVGFSRGEGEDFEFDDRPTLIIGGNLRVSRTIALVSENWILFADESHDSVVPVGVAVRIFGEHLSADLGVILVKEVLKEGFPIPWLSVTYNFGQ